MGRRTIEPDGRKLNLVKVFSVLITFVFLIGLLTGGTCNLDNVFTSSLPWNPSNCFFILLNLSGRLVIDLSLFVLGVKFFGKKFLLYSILATITFSNTYRLWEHIGFLIPSLSHNMFLASVLAGIFVGIGVGLVVRGGGASGGDDVIALIANKLIKIKINHVYLITDSIVLLLSLIYLDMKQLFFSIIAVTISGKIISMLYKDDDEDKDEVNEDKNKEMLNLEVNE